MKTENVCSRKMFFILFLICFLPACGNHARNGKSGENIAETTLQPELKDSSFHVSGTLVFAHESHSFTPEGDTISYWIIDKTGMLIKAYNDLTGGTKNGKPVYAGLEVVDAGKSDEGFAASYPSVYHVVKIDSLYLKRPVQSVTSD